MLKENRLFYLWCTLAGGIALVAILNGNSLIYQSIAEYDSNRWIHFLTYASLVAIPFAVWKHKWSLLFSFIPPILGIMLESLQSHVPSATVHAQNIPADLFGVAAGILLGLNLRAMHSPAKPTDSAGSAPPGSDTH
jgi:hypothetical protein